PLLLNLLYTYQNSYGRIFIFSLISYSTTFKSTVYLPKQLWADIIKADTITFELPKQLFADASYVTKNILS
ncbi:MAG: hypothetical protein AAB769_01090, partial [Patescibacteria group bacterium]